MRTEIAGTSSERSRYTVTFDRYNTYHVYTIFCSLELLSWKQWICPFQYANIHSIYLYARGSSLLKYSWGITCDSHNFKSLTFTRALNTAAWCKQGLTFPFVAQSIQVPFVPQKVQQMPQCNNFWLVRESSKRDEANGTGSYSIKGGGGNLPHCSQLQMCNEKPRAAVKRRALNASLFLRRDWQQ